METIKIVLKTHTKKLSFGNISIQSYKTQSQTRQFETMQNIMKKQWI